LLDPDPPSPAIFSTERKEGGGARKGLGGLHVKMFSQGPRACLKAIRKGQEGVFTRMGQKTCLLPGKGTGGGGGGGCHPPDGLSGARYKRRFGGGDGLMNGAEFGELVTSYIRSRANHGRKGGRVLGTSIPF